MLSIEDLLSQQDLESGPSNGSTDRETSIHLFFSEVEIVRQEMLSIQDLLSQLNRENDARKSEWRQEALRSLSERINEDMVKTVHKARAVGARLESMDRRLDPKDLMRVSVVRGLSTKLREILEEFQGLRQRMVEENRDAVARCYFMITGEKPSEEVIEEMISSGSHTPELLVKKAIVEGDQAILSMVQEMEEKQESAREVERSLLEEATAHQSSTKKTWLWILLVVLVLIVLAVMASIVWFSLSNRNPGFLSAAGFIFDFVSE